MSSPTEPTEPVIFEINGRFFGYVDGRETQFLIEDTIKRGEVVEPQGDSEDPDPEDDSDSHSDDTDDDYSKMGVDELKQVAKRGEGGRKNTQSASTCLQSVRSLQLAHSSRTALTWIPLTA